MSFNINRPDSGSRSVSLSSMEFVGGNDSLRLTFDSIPQRPQPRSSTVLRSSRESLALEAKKSKNPKVQKWSIDVGRKTSFAQEAKKHAKRRAGLMAFLGVVATAGAVTAVVLTGGVAAIPLVALAIGVGLAGGFGTGLATYGTYQYSKKSDFKAELNRLSSECEKLNSNGKIDSDTYNRATLLKGQITKAIEAKDYEEAARQLEQLDRLLTPLMSKFERNQYQRREKEQIALRNFLEDADNKLDESGFDIESVSDESESLGSTDSLQSIDSRETEFEMELQDENFEPGFQLQNPEVEEIEPNHNDIEDRLELSIEDEPAPPNYVEQIRHLLVKGEATNEEIENWNKLGLIDETVVSNFTEDQKNTPMLKVWVSSLREAETTKRKAQKSIRARQAIDEYLEERQFMLPRNNERNVTFVSGRRTSVDPDGNCFYESVARQVDDDMQTVRHKTQGMGQKVLKEVEEEVLDGPITYFPLNGAKIPGDELRNQVNNRTIATSAKQGGKENWADERFAALIVDVYDRPVIVLRYNDNERLESGEVTLQTYQNERVKNNTPIILAYDGFGHFDGVELQNI